MRCRGLAALLLGLLVVQELSAVSPPTATPGGLDLVVLVDQSASMSGGGLAGSDPRGLRNLLAAFTLEILARGGETQHLRHRFSVVSFGATARVDVPLTELRPVPGARAARGRGATAPAGPRHDRFLRRLRPGGVSARGASRLGAPARHPPDHRRHAFRRSGERRRTARPGRTPCCHRLLRASSRDRRPAAPGPASPARQSFCRLLRTVSRGRFQELAGGRGEALTELHRAVADALGTSSARSAPGIAAGSETAALVLPPYLDLVVFDILDEAPGQPVAILPPGSADRPLAATAPGVEQVRLGQVLRTVAIRRPAAGIWTFRQPGRGARIKILSQQFFPRGELVVPAVGILLRQHDRSPIAYRLVDGEGRPIQELPGYPLRPELSLRWPDGRQERRAMAQRSELGPAAFGTAQAAKCDLPGHYWTEVAVVTRDLEDHPVEVFRDRWSGFSVSPATRIDCQVMSPRPGDSVPFPRQLLSLNRPILARLRCLDPAQHPFPLETIVRGSPARLLHPSLWRDNLPTPVSLDLKYLGRGVYRGWLRRHPARLVPAPARGRRGAGPAAVQRPAPPGRHAVRA